MVFSLAQANDTQWQELRIRTTERGELRDLFAVRRVWTIYEDKAVEELLVVRKEKNGKCSYSLCNAPFDTPLSKRTSGSEIAFLFCNFEYLAVNFHYY